MAHFQKQYGATPQETDEYGNPVTAATVRDEFVNPVHHGTTGGTGTGNCTAPTGTTGYGATTTEHTGFVGAAEGTRQDRGGTAVLHRSGSSSSSSSEDDGLGGRRKKKGLKEKIKEKLPGGNKDDAYYSHQTTATAGGDHRHVQEKIKEKPPGTAGHREEQYSTHTTTTPSGGEATTYSEENKEKKGIVDKIKEKLPGHH